MLLRKKAEQLLKKELIADNKELNNNISRLIHELNVHQIELEMQNDELQRSLFNLEESQNRYRELYESAPIGYFSLNEKNIIMEVNLMGASLLGYERRQLIKMPFSYFIPKDHQNTFYNYRKRAFTTQVKQTCELELINKNGSQFYAHLECILVDGHPNKKRQLLISIIDISELKSTELKLQASEAKFRTFLETTKEWAWSIDINGNYFYTNPSIEYILGYKPKELLGKNCLHLIHKDDRKRAATKLFLSVKENREWNDLVLRWQHKDGSYRQLESNVVAVFDNEDNIREFRGTTRDITLRKQNEDQQLRHQQKINQAAKVSSMGELASLLAHELAQPLTAINNFTVGCVRRLESGRYQQQELLSVMKEAAQQAERAGKIIHSIKDFVRKGKLHFETIDIHQVIKASVATVKREFDDVLVKTQVKFSHTSLYLDADKIQIELVLLNLFRNAIEAMKNNSSKHPKKLIILSQSSGNNAINVSVIDNGLGFPAEMADKVFEPCFTTKPDSLGMGLAICNSIIEAHGGQLTAKSAPQSGACFEFILPITQKKDFHDAN